MGRRRKALLVVVGLALVTSPAFVFPNGGLAASEYETPAFRCGRRSSGTRGHRSAG